MRHRGFEAEKNPQSPDIHLRRCRLERQRLEMKSNGHRSPARRIARDPGPA